MALANCNYHVPATHHTLPCFTNDDGNILARFVLAYLWGNSRCSIVLSAKQENELSEHLPARAWRFMMKDDEPPSSLPPSPPLSLSP